MSRKFHLIARPAILVASAFGSFALAAESAQRSSTLATGFFAGNVLT